MKILKALFSRVSFTILMILADIALVYGIYHYFDSKYVWIDYILRILGIIVVIYITNNSTHLSADVMWIIIILIFPVPGTIIYFLLFTNLLPSRTYRNLKDTYNEALIYYPNNRHILDELVKKDKDISGQFKYIDNYANYPFYDNSSIEYYPSGEDGYPEILKELKKAKKFIFIEYFIIKEGEMWDSILEILEDKVKQGVDVRVIYDDLGSFTSLSAFYQKTLEKKGIKCIPFNRINPVIGSIANHRDHRKILVIDGKVAFSGGINISDEYINLIHKHGYWKDNVIKIKGDAVWSYTVMFLTHFNALRHTDDDYFKFRAKPRKIDGDGYIAPYGETPLDSETVSQNIYLNIINEAKKYCYIFTPYLIIDNEMVNALLLARKRGVDVRIVTPGVPDKKLVYSITKSYFKALIAGGIKIYKYTPGFIHSKVFVCDDTIATVGTINLDYRSLYLHFENGTYIYKASVIKDIKKDVLDTIACSHEVKLEECKSHFFISILKVFASMM